MRKKDRTREVYIAAKNAGGARPYNTSNGVVYLNVIKHWCMNEPYINEEFQNIMFAEIKRRRDAYNESKKNE